MAQIAYFSHSSFPKASDVLLWFPLLLVVPPDNLSFQLHGVSTLSHPSVLTLKPPAQKLMTSLPGEGEGHLTTFPLS